ncbi:MAG: hypothetical protein QM723_16710 [Myxococcaceae bacterium]
MQIIRGLAVSMLVLCACTKGDAGPQGAQGPKGDTGPAGGTTASVSAITPLGVYAGRDYEIQVSGNNTAWTSSTTINFGAGITVNKVVSASATSLVAQITVSPTAAIGTRDVTIADTNMDAFKGAFHVDSPAAFGVIAGSVAQGSVIFGKITANDVAHPFDETHTGDGLFSALVYTNVSLDAGTGFTLSADTVYPTSISYTMLVDVNAPTASQTVDIVSGDPTGPASGLTTTEVPDAFQVQQRAPTMANPNMTTTVTTTQPFESALLGFAAPTMLQLADLTVTGADPNSAAKLYLIPASGKWADATGTADTTPVLYLIEPGTVSSAVLFDGAGIASTYQVVFNSETVATTTNEAPNAGTVATAQQVDALPYVMKQGVLNNGTYQHVLRFNLAMGDVGKKIHAGTLSAGDPQTDTVVEVLTGADGGTSFAISDDSAFLDDIVSDPTTAAGDYWVVITASSYYDPMHQPFNAFIRLEP